jgi:hypothetical protein
MKKLYLFLCLSVAGYSKAMEESSKYNDAKKDFEMIYSFLSQKHPKITECFYTDLTEMMSLCQNQGDYKEYVSQQMKWRQEAIENVSAYIIGYNESDQFVAESIISHNNVCYMSELLRLFSKMIDANKSMEIVLEDVKNIAYNDAKKDFERIYSFLSQKHPKIAECFDTDLTEMMSLCQNRDDYKKYFSQHMLLLQKEIQDASAFIIGYDKLDQFVAELITSHNNVWYMYEVLRSFSKIIDTNKSMESMLEDVKNIATACKNNISISKK